MPYLFIELFYIHMPVVRTDGRTYGHVITKIYQIFVGMGLRSRARGAPLQITQKKKMVISNIEFLIILSATTSETSITLSKLIFLLFKMGKTDSFKPNPYVRTGLSLFICSMYE